MKAWRTAASSTGFSFPFCKSNDACHPELWEMHWTVTSAVRNMWQFHLICSKFDHFCQISLAQICRWCSWHNWISAPSSFPITTEGQMLVKIYKNREQGDHIVWKLLNPISNWPWASPGESRYQICTDKMNKYIFFKYVKAVNSLSKGWKRNLRHEFISFPVCCWWHWIGALPASAFWEIKAISDLSETTLLNDTRNFSSSLRA